MLLNGILEAVGNVPLLQLSRISSGRVFAKAEFLNPGGSIQDRVAKHIFESAIREGRLRPGMTIIAATSGHTGIGLCLVAAQRGYPVICVMPENVSDERKRIIQTLGGEIVEIPAEQAFAGCLNQVHEIAAAKPERFFVVNPCTNPCEAEIHYQQTGPEIWQELKGLIDIFVVGLDNGGTLQGIGRFLKEKNPAVKIVAVEPLKDTILVGRETGQQLSQGIGPSFAPDGSDMNLVDQVFTVSDEAAIDTTRRLALEEGLLVGISSGANVFAALQLDNGRKRVVTILTDRAERYFSTMLHERRSYATQNNEGAHLTAAGDGMVSRAH